MSQKRVWNSKIIECACGFGEAFIKIMPEPAYGNDDPQWYLEFIPVHKRFIFRLESAWRIIRGKDPEFAGLYIDKQDLIDMRKWIDESLGNK